MSEDMLDLTAWLDKKFSEINKRIAGLEDANRFDLPELTKGGASNGYELACCQCGRTPNNHDKDGVCFEWSDDI